MKLFYYPSIDSTNQQAKRIFSDQPEIIKAGAVILADRQTQGKGSYGKGWYSGLGGLYYTILFKYDPGSMGDITTILETVGTIVVDVCKELAGILPILEWPNDVIIGDKKLGGILVETNGFGSQHAEKFILIGIGLNLNQQGFPNWLTPIAVSVRQVNKRITSRASVVLLLTQKLVQRYSIAG